MLRTLIGLLLFACAIQANAQTCMANFSFVATTTTVPFTDLSTTAPGDAIVSWFWDFDDGSTATQQHPTHTFPAIDKYDVELTITTASGCQNKIKIRVEICKLTLTMTQGACNADGQIPVTFTVLDVYGVAETIDISVDGTLLPGSPFNIETTNPITTTALLPGDGLWHDVTVQSDIPTCGFADSIHLADCGSNCFLSSLAVNFAGGTTKNIIVAPNGTHTFSPISTTIVIGDKVHFTWQGSGHSTTSDTTSGPDAWNSGIIGIGSVFDLVLRNPGLHPYYCIPHGAPGGVGMSGTIIANCPASGSFPLNLTFNTTQANPGGYNVLIDNVLQPGSPHPYTGTGQQTVSANIPGDGLVHLFKIQDVTTPTCTAERSFTAPDCGAAPPCSLSVTAQATGGCNPNQTVPVAITVTAINPDTLGFNVLIDNQLLTGSPFTYNTNGPTTVNTNIIGNGLPHSIMVMDAFIDTCMASTSITTANCAIPCSITNLTATTGSPMTHTVMVHDFNFDPKNITITAGDQVQWQWMAQIQHTSTSDATSGPASWNSGLLGNGASYTSPILPPGLHPYYCIPHGGPGGVGMSGTITVLSPCNNGQVSISLGFTSVSGGSGGYNVKVDGVTVPGSPFAYAPNGNNSLTVNAPGDGASHTVTVTDAANPNCTASTSVTTQNCNGSNNCSLILGASQNGGCNADGQVPYLATVQSANAGTHFNLKIDGITAPGSPFVYDASGMTSLNLLVPGDGQPHLLEVVDVDSLGCTSMLQVTPPDCTPDCVFATQLTQTGGCQGNLVVYNLMVMAQNNSASFSLLLDGVPYPGSPFNYGPLGMIDLPINLPGDGQMHMLTLADLDIPSCGDMLTVTTPNCSVGCQLTGLVIDPNVPVLHVVEVHDFEFVPANITVAIGDTLRFIWTGQIPHTVTSYATSGADVFNSGLLGQGAVFELVIHETGDHPYYCIPHEAMGMKGGITAVDPCDDGELAVKFSFQQSNGGAGYKVFLDGNLLAGSPFTYTGAANQVVVTLPANGQSVSLLIEDANDPTCSLAQNFVMPNCADPCFGYQANWTADIDHQNFSVQFANTSAVAATSFLWTFGDTGASTAENPSHTYAAAGLYEVCLSIGDGNCASTYCDSILVGEYFCEANFTVVSDGLTVSLTDISNTTEAVDNWTWDFGNGTSIVGGGSLNYSFDTLGIYQICLSIGAGACAADTCITVDLSDPCLLLNADYTLSIDVPTLTAHFVDLTTGSPNKWLWGFGDASTSSQQNPQHTYAAPGFYNVCLLVQNTQNGCNDNKCQVVQMGTTGVGEPVMGNWKLSVYPNPASSAYPDWTITGLHPADFGQPLSLFIHDFQGRTILESRVTGAEKVKVPHKNKEAIGIYFLELRSNSGRIYRGRVVVQ